MGRAIIVLQENDPRPFDGIVLNASLHDLSYDHQLEGSRGQYVVDLIRLSGNPAYLRAQVSAALLLTPNENSEDLCQLFELARRFADEGDLEARAAMYQRFAALAADPASFGEGTLHEGAEDIVQLDGIEGFLYVAEKLGERALADADEWFDDDLRCVLEQKVGTSAVQRAIEEARQQSEAAAAYLALVDEHTQRIAGQPKQGKLTTLSYDALKARIEEAEGGLPRGGSLLGKWASAASPEDVEQAARDLITERDPDRLRGYLLVFRSFAFPLDPQPLIALAEHEDAKVSRAALIALSNVHHPLVRQLALEMLAAPSRLNSDMAVDLLTSNYQPGDYALIAQRLAWEQDTDTYHWLGYYALRVFEANPAPECAEVLVSLYDRGPCTTCRERCVDLLHRLGLLPDWMARECLFDANCDLRNKARNYRSSSQE